MMFSTRLFFKHSVSLFAFLGREKNLNLSGIYMISLKYK